MKKTLILYTLFYVTTLSSFGQVSSNFNVDNEGWTVFDNDAGSSTAATYNSIGGNPGGFDSFTTSSGALNMYWTAPAEFNGNFSFSYNQTLTFDLNVSTAGIDNTLGDVKLIDPISGLTLVYQLPAKPLANQWNSYSVQLNESFWHVGSPAGAIATQNQMKQILVNLGKFQIRAKYLSGNTSPYTSSIANIVLNSRVLTAPPIITVFTPQSSLTGATMTITGSNFNTTASQNIVYFSGVKATPSSATATQLVVTIPARAAYGQIIVENLGTSLQGISTQSFNPLFDNNEDFGGRIIPASMGRGYQVLLQNGTEAPSTTNSFGALDKGDLDGDGWIDLVATETGTTKLYVYRNKGTGGNVSVGSFDNAMALALVSGVSGMAGMIVADLDSDGKLDIAASVSDGFTGRYAIYRNTSVAGSISFDPPVVFNYPYYSALNMAAGDLDGDGRVDLMAVTGTAPSNIYICQNISTPGVIDFAAGTTFSYAGVGSYSDILVGDLNADGRPEIIAPHYGGFPIQIFENASAPGTIFMKAPFNYSPGTSLFNAQFAVGDLDADNKPDLAWCANGSLSVYLAKNIFNGTTFDATSFSSQILIPSKIGNLTGVGIGDINADGNPDIILTGSSDLAICQNTGAPGALGSTSFQPTVLFQGSAGGQFLGAIGPVIADLDGDNKPEVSFLYSGNPTVVEKGLYIFHNESYPAPHIATMTPSSGTPGATVNLTGDHFSTGSGFPPVSGRLGKVATAIVPSSNTAASAIVPLGVSGRFSFTEHGLTAYSKPFRVLFNTDQTINSSSFGPSVDFALAINPRDALDVADFDDDGRVDVAVIDNGFTAKIFQNTQAIPGQSITTASLALQSTTYSAGYNLIALDIDGDGKIDLNSGGGLLQNTTSGTISFTSVTSTAGGFTTSSSADFNKDGKTDLVFANGGLNVQIYENLSRNGSFTPNGTFQNFGGGAINLVVPAVPYSVAAADFDGDGYEDIISVNPNGANNSTYFLNNKNSGTLQTASFSSLDHSVSGLLPYDVTANDFDGDGKIDIAITYFNSTFVSVMLNNSVLGNISFTGTDVPVANNKGYKITSQDLDGDGKAEIVVIHQPNPGPGSFTVLQNKCTTGTVNFTTTNFPITRNPQAVKIADINSDSKPDILIVANSGTVGNDLMVFENKIASGPVITITAQPSDFIACAGDVATFTAAATGTTNIVYQWQFSLTGAVGTFSDIANGGGYTNANTATLSVNTAGNFGAGRYRCKISGDLATTVFTNDEGLFINPIPGAPTTTPDADCIPAALTLTASGGANGQYRWYTVATGGTAIAGQTNNTYITPVISTTTTYYVSINNGSCESTRTSVVASINPITKPILTPSTPAVSGTVNICSGDALTISAPSGFTTYTWSNGASTNPITITTTTSLLTVQVSDGVGCISPLSDALNIVLNPYPVATITVNGTQLSTSPGDSYQWYQNGDKVQGATNQSFDFNFLEYGLYQVDVTGNGCTSTSAPFEYLITGLEKMNSIFKVYPNPVTSKELFIVCSKGATVTIFDMLGRNLKELTLAEGSTPHAISVHELNSGQYILTIQSQKTTTHVKIKIE